MINIQLLDFIRKQLLLGLTKEKIKEELVSGGWNSLDIEEGFNAIASGKSINEPESNQNKELIENKSNLGKKVFILVLILFLISITAGAYYFRESLLETSVIKSIFPNYVSQESTNNEDTTVREAEVAQGVGNLEEGITSDIKEQEEIISSNSVSKENLGGGIYSYNKNDEDTHDVEFLNNSFLKEISYEEIYEDVSIGSSQLIKFKEGQLRFFNPNDSSKFGDVFFKSVDGVEKPLNILELRKKYVISLNSHPWNGMFFIEYPYLFITLIEWDGIDTFDWKLLVYNLDSIKYKIFDFKYYLADECGYTSISNIAFDDGYFYWSQYKDGMPFGPVKKCTGSYKKKIELDF